MPYEFEKGDLPTDIPLDGMAFGFTDDATEPESFVGVDGLGNVYSLADEGLEYRVQNFIHITATGTYTPPTNIRALFVECIGAGGGGGGCLSLSSAGSGGGGGGSGAYSAALLKTNVIGVHDVVVGVAGTAGASGANNGGTGGDTEFEDTAGTVVVRAKGGSGGVGDTDTGVHIGGDGGAGGVASSGIGDVKQNGSYGETGMIIGVNSNMSGGGASGPYGGGGARRDGAPQTGGTATDYGAGGGGGSVGSVNNQRAGGAGFQGVIIVWELI